MEPHRGAVSTRLERGEGVRTERAERRHEHGLAGNKRFDQRVLGIAAGQHGRCRDGGFDQGFRRRDRAERT